MGGWGSCDVGLTLSLAMSHKKGEVRGKQR